MQEGYRIVEGPYLGDILDQPSAVQATLDGFREADGLFERIGTFAQGSNRRVLLTGMGSSLHALYPMELRLLAGRECVNRVETAELIHSMPALLAEATLIVAVSQSGRSVEILRLIEQNAGKAAVIGVTNTAESPLANQANLTLLTHCGEEFSVSAKTYLGTLAALEVLGAAWDGEDARATFDELQAAPALIGAYLANWRDHVAELAGLVDGASQIFITGRGRSLAACCTGALITKESTHSPAEGMSSATFRHGPIEMAGPRTLVLVMEGDAKVRALNAKLVRDVRDRGGRAELIAPAAELGGLRNAGGPARLQPLMEILPIQMLTLAIAANAGVEAGRFVHATKVTAEE